MATRSMLTAERLIAERCNRGDEAIVLITHSLQQARRLADEVLFFHKGKLAEHGAAKTLLTAPTTPELQQFLEFYGV